jgi:hypothetical protein
MAKRVSGKRADGEKAVASGRKVHATGIQKPVRRPTRAAGVRRTKPVATEQPTAAESPPAGVHIDDVTVEADEPQLERSQLRALLSVRRGDQLVYAERVNLDWPGGRDKFLRKASRALVAAGVATRIGEAVLGDLRGLLRTRPDASA